MAFNFTVSVEQPLSTELQGAFEEMLTAVQAGMNRAASENAELQNQVKELKQQAAQLRDDNQCLTKRLAQSQSQQPARGEGGAKVAGEGNGSGEEEFTLERVITIHEAPVHSVTMSPGTNVIATASWDATVKLYNLATEEVVTTLGDKSGPGEKGEMGGLYAVAFAKTSEEVLGCTSADKAVYVWDHRNSRLLNKLVGHSDEVNGIDFHESQQVMCTASDDCQVIIWDFQEGIALRTLKDHTEAVYGACFLGQEHQYYVATCCFDQKARVFDMRDKHVVATLEHHTDDVIGISCCPGGNLLATGSDDGNIAIWDMRTWELRNQINTTTKSCPDNEVKRVAFSPDGSLLAAACSSGKVLLYSVPTATPKLVASLGGHTDCVFDICWGTCQNSKVLVSASHDKSCRYWREARC